LGNDVKGSLRPWLVGFGNVVWRDQNRDVGWTVALEPSSSFVGADRLAGAIAKKDIQLIDPASSRPDQMQVT
jgi:hypothetical protein